MDDAWGDVFEDAKRIVVRIEAPGVDKDDFDVQVLDDLLMVRGEKRFEREGTEGRWRMRLRQLSSQPPPAGRREKR